MELCELPGPSQSSIYECFTGKLLEILYEAVGFYPEEFFGCFAKLHVGMLLQEALLVVLCKAPGRRSTSTSSLIREAAVGKLLNDQ